MNRPASLHIAFGFNCTRPDASYGPAHCVLCYGALVRACALVFYGRA